MEIRRTRGWAAKGAAALAAAAVLTGAPSAVRAIPAAAAANCHDAEVVFARGTNEPKGLGRVGDSLVDSLRQQTNGMDIGAYGVDYAASKLQLHGGDGANDAISHIKSTLASCPSTKFVLGGYSQGASVIDILAGVPIGGISWGNQLPAEYVSSVAAVATFGDVADRAGGSLPTMSASLGSKAIDLCNPNDPICHAGPGNEWSGHTEGYVPVYTTQAAAFVAAKLMGGTGSTVPGSTPPVAGYTPPQAPGTPGSAQVPSGPAPSIHGDSPTPGSPVPAVPPTATAPDPGLVSVS